VEVRRRTRKIVYAGPAGVRGAARAPDPPVQSHPRCVMESPSFDHRPPAGTYSLAS
jgi:hypothetical protein